MQIEWAPTMGLWRVEGNSSSPAAVFVHEAIHAWHAISNPRAHTLEVAYNAPLRSLRAYLASPAGVIAFTKISHKEWNAIFRGERHFTDFFSVDTLGHDTIRVSEDIATQMRVRRIEQQERAKTNCSTLDQAFRILAVSGCPNAQCTIGSILYEGTALPRNLDLAEAWLRLATRQGLVTAHARLARSLTAKNDVLPT